MNARANTDRLWADPQLRETEFALAISPVPRIESATEPAHAARFQQKGGTHQRFFSDRVSGSAAFEDETLMDALSLGWAIAIAIAVALTVYTSGG